MIYLISFSFHAQYAEMIFHNSLIKFIRLTSL